ncbi:hypothetical protein Tcan_13091 [Toxocara canis]|uniref:Uncharacterized protein n=1 Tax=Toxocara canis TaxID=6265 RepID=A0A0B2UUY0_TOXCA|nr:hypothetical protein Tcan_13091 [Toxocara canis]
MFKFQRRWGSRFITRNNSSLKTANFRNLGVGTEVYVGGGGRGKHLQLQLYWFEVVVRTPQNIRLRVESFQLVNDANSYRATRYTGVFPGGFRIAVVLWAAILKLSFGILETLRRRITSNRRLPRLLFFLCGPSPFLTPPPDHLRAVLEDSRQRIAAHRQYAPAPK